MSDDDSFSPESPIGFAVAGWNMPESDNHKTRNILKILLDNGCDINERGSYGNILLASPIFAGQTELISFLLRNGADPHLVLMDRVESNNHGMDAFQIVEKMQNSGRGRDAVVHLLRNYRDGF